MSSLSHSVWLNPLHTHTHTQTHTSKKVAKKLLTQSVPHPLTAVFSPLSGADSKSALHATWPIFFIYIVAFHVISSQVFIYDCCEFENGMQQGES